MDGFDRYVEKITLHNKLVTPEQIAQAKAYQLKHPGVGLLDVLFRANLIKKTHFDAITESYRAQAGAGSSAASVPSSSGADIPRDGSAKRMLGYLATARHAGASDLHIMPNSPPLIRRDLKLTPLDPTPISPKETEALLMSVLSEAERAKLQSERFLDTALQVSPTERYRICFLKQKDGYDGAFRFIAERVKSAKELGLPEAVLNQLMGYHQGLVLVTGPSGSGKSTTVAAMLEILNQTRHAHIITLEDPIENVFVANKAHFSQRQTVSHTASFSAALRAALREDPDVIMIGELRDFETASLAVTAAETGHLVISTLHTTSAVNTITRLLDTFPADQKSQVRTMVSESLRGIICQKLIPKKEGEGVVLACEILINSMAIGAMIRKEQFIQIPSMLQMGGTKGMRLMDQSVADFFRTGVISGEDAYFAAENNLIYEKFAPKEE